MANQIFNIQRVLANGLSGGLTLALAPFVLTFFNVTLTVQPEGFMSLFIAGAVLNGVIGPIVMNAIKV